MRESVQSMGNIENGQIKIHYEHQDPKRRIVVIGSPGELTEMVEKVSQKVCIAPELELEDCKLELDGAEGGRVCFWSDSLDGSILIEKHEIPKLLAYLANVNKWWYNTEKEKVTWVEK